ncbi:TPA: helicase, partial [Candidatus Micrarchaeota archaeon]|nr:helicase [Candidatus Micrarchaeota archaeon]
NINSQEQTMNATAETFQSDTDTEASTIIPLSQFVSDFGEGLLEAVPRQNPPVYNGTPEPRRDAVMAGLKRQPFPPQQDLVQAVTRLLLDEGEQAAVINAEMGTGKTMMAICAAAVLHAEGYRRTLVIAPPHLVYKWRREILETVPNARVRVFNGPDTLRKLLELRETLVQVPDHRGPEFFIMGRVRMRMGFHWRPAYAQRKRHTREHTERGNEQSRSFVRTQIHAACPACGATVVNSDGDPIPPDLFPTERRQACRKCGGPLWTLIRPGSKQKTQHELVKEAMCQLPTIGPKTADKLLRIFGEELLAGMLADNVHEFINLMDS